MRKRNFADVKITLLKIFVFLVVFYCSAYSAASAAETAGFDLSQKKTYIVVASIDAIAQEPGVIRERGLEVHNAFFIYRDTPGLIAPLAYGMRVEALPPEAGEFTVLNSSGDLWGHVPVESLAELPQYEAFPPEPVTFVTDSPNLCLLPERFPLLEFASETPFLKGETVDALGLHVVSSGEVWYLLFFSERDEAEKRYAWCHENELLRLSTYTPDTSILNPDRIPLTLRERTQVPSKLIRHLTTRGFAIDETPPVWRLQGDWVMQDKMIHLYPDPRDTFTAPNFVTTDLFLHSFHLVFSKALKEFEKKAISPELELLLTNSLNELLGIKEKISPKTPFENRIFERAHDFLAIPLLLLSPDCSVAVSSKAREELENIQEAKEVKFSPLTGRSEDYTFYRPRGHYAPHALLARYFRAMSFLGGATLYLNERDIERQRENAAVAALLTGVLSVPKINREWRKIDEALDLLVGKVDNASLKDYEEIVAEFAGVGWPFGEPSALDALRLEMLKRTRPSLIFGQSPWDDALKGFRLMGRRAVLDAEILSRLIAPSVPGRLLPKGNDVMALLGSQAAWGLLESERKTFPSLRSAVEELKPWVSERLDTADALPVSEQWLLALRRLFVSSTYPASSQFFHKTPEWEAKKLLTSSASWAELKHNTVLYAEQPSATAGGKAHHRSRPKWYTKPYEKPMPRGYVEPEPEVFQAIMDNLKRLSKLKTIWSDELLRKRSVSSSQSYEWHGDDKRPPEPENRGPYLPVYKMIDGLFAVTSIYRDIARKEVENTPLTLNDYRVISNISTFLGSNIVHTFHDNFDDFLPENDQRTPLITDIATDVANGRVLQVGTGVPRRIYVFVDDRWGGPRTTVGAVYSYYEFERSLDSGRMTDEEWRALVYDTERQDELAEFEPAWIKNLTKISSEDISLDLEKPLR